MNQHYHANAVTNVRIRGQLQNKSIKISQKSLAKELGVSEQTMSKWAKRDFVEDKSSRPHTIHYSYTDLEEALVVSLRRSTWFSKEVVQETLLEQGISLSPSTVYNLFKKHGINRQPEEQKALYKTFKEYEPGYLHIDVTYNPKLEGTKSYLFVAIDRATRLVYYRLYDNKTAENAVTFLKHCLEFFPFEITTILTDNGLEFTNKLLVSKKGQPCTKDSAFDTECTKETIEHRLTPVASPKTNGMVERANGTIKQNVHAKTKFQNLNGLQQELLKFLIFYNLNRRHGSLKKELKVKTPFDALEYWYQLKPELFYKSPSEFKTFLLNLSNIYSTTSIT
jgi:transposase-like protein